MFCTVLALLISFQGTVELDLWVNKEEPIYQPFENLSVFFSVSEDCYVTIYDIEVGGEEDRLFPPDGEDGWVESGRVYRIPADDDEFEYRIEGPAGIETIIACAAREFPPVLHDQRPGITQAVVEIYIKEPEPAKLRFISTPDDCRIYITEVITGEKEYAGRAPQTIVIRPGDYIVEIKRTGFFTMKRRIAINAGEQRRIFVRLAPY